MTRRRKKKTEGAPTSVVGEVVLSPLDSVKPNDWNDNKMPKRKYESLVHGLRTSGWLKSHSLTIWGSDENGEVMNIIIDGEHRHRAASGLGWEEGPMVFVHGITKAEAMKLTPKLNNRGKSDPDLLVKLILEVRELQPEHDDLALELGMTDEEFVKLMGPFDDGPPTSKTPSQSKDVHTVKLAFKTEDHIEFKRLVQVCAKLEETTTASDTILKVLQEHEAKWA